MTSVGMLESKEADFVYFHTNYTETTSMLIVEIVVTRDLNGQKTQMSAGYTICPIFEFSQTAKLAYIQSGTPRQISSTDQDQQSLN